MKKIALLIGLVILLCATAVPSSGADLQAGWYAWPFAPYVYSERWDGYPYLRAAGAFVTAPGVYGPFTLTDGEYGGTLSRKATVTSDMQDAGPTDSLVLPISLDMSIGEKFLYMHISWGTSYDSTQMCLELWRTRYDGSTQRIWMQGLSGIQSGSNDILQGGEYEGSLFYRITVIPEPLSGTGLCLLIAVAGLVRFTRSRR